MVAGISATGPNNDKYSPWQLYAANAQVRAAAQAYYFGGGQPPQTPTSATGFQAYGAGFDWRNLGKYDTTLTGVQPEPKVAAVPKTEVAAPTVEEAYVNPFSNKEPVSEVAPAATIAKGGDQQLQSALAGIGTGELTPKVNGGALHHLAWA